MAYGWFYVSTDPQVLALAEPIEDTTTIQDPLAYVKRQNSGAWDWLVLNIDGDRAASLGLGPEYGTEATKRAAQTAVERYIVAYDQQSGRGGDERTSDIYGREHFEDACPDQDPDATVSETPTLQTLARD